MTPRKSVSLLLLLLALSSLLAVSHVRGGGGGDVAVAAGVAAAAGDVFDARRVHETVCCERAQRHWRVLREWARACAAKVAAVPRRGGDKTNDNDDGDDDALRRRFVQMLLQQRAGPASPDGGGDGVAQTVAAVCAAGALHTDALRAYMRHAYCDKLPRSHLDLAQSSLYSALADEHPANEDDLIALIERSCEQQRRDADAGDAVRERWLAALRGKLASDAEVQRALCGATCHGDDSDDDDGRRDL